MVGIERKWNSENVEELFGMVGFSETREKERKHYKIETRIEWPHIVANIKASVIHAFLFTHTHTSPYANATLNSSFSIPANTLPPLYSSAFQRTPSRHVSC